MGIRSARKSDGTTSATKLWNVTFEIRSSDTLASFKFKLKTGERILFVSLLSGCCAISGFGRHLGLADHSIRFHACETFESRWLSEVPRVSVWMPCDFQDLGAIMDWLTTRLDFIRGPRDRTHFTNHDNYLS